MSNSAILIFALRNFKF